jgi:small subunit ribosomal protein S9
MADDESKQGEVNEPEEIAAEDSVGAQETPTERQQERERAIADEPVAESEQRAAEAAAPSEPPSRDEPEAEETVVEGDEVLTDEDLAEDEEEPTPRVKPEIPGAELEPDIVREGEEALRLDEEGYEDDELSTEEAEELLATPITDAAIDLGAGARYRATGKRKTAVARVILLPGNGAYTINGRTLEVYFPRPGLQRNIRQALETVGLEAKMDVVAKMHGGGVAAQAGALRHGISRALVDADPHLRGELKRRGFLTRDSRVKERKKAGLKKARKRPQFSKR